MKRARAETDPSLKHAVLERVAAARTLDEVAGTAATEGDDA